MSKKSKTKKNDRLMKRKAGKEKLKKEQSESTISLETESEQETSSGNSSIKILFNCSPK